MTIDWIVTAKAAVLGLIQGLSEFLPISSTGHLIIGNELLGTEDESWKVFDVFIQLGSILAVCWEYRARLLASVGGLLRRDAAAWRFWILLGIAFMPAAAVGFVAHDVIKRCLFGPIPVMAALVVGGLIILWVEKWYETRKAAPVAAIGDMTWRQALGVGLAQVLSLIPGTSRSGSTIIGGMGFGLSRKTATEFTFFLAIPVMFAATLYDLYKSRHDLSLAVNGVPFAVGFVVAFVSALLVIRWLLRYVSTHDFRPFALYRIGLAGIILVYLFIR